jgi:hypothetical protein
MARLSGGALTHTLEGADLGEAIANWRDFANPVLFTASPERQALVDDPKDHPFETSLQNG